MVTSIRNYVTKACLRYVTIGVMLPLIGASDASSKPKHYLHGQITVKLMAVKMCSISLEYYVVLA